MQPSIRPVLRPITNIKNIAVPNYTNILIRSKCMEQLIYHSLRLLKVVISS